MEVSTIARGIEVQSNFDPVYSIALVTFESSLFSGREEFDLQTKAQTKFML